MPLRSFASQERCLRDIMGAIRGQFYSRVAVPGPSCLQQSGLIERYASIREAN